MPTYVIGYDLNTPGQDYGELFEAIKSYGLWWHHLDSTWIIRTERSAVEVRDHLKRFIDKNDKLLVAKLTSEAAWTGINQKGSKWLKDYL
ncbi:MAG: SinR family protein [Cutibacterium sp.]|nr:SinR family protein [Cutibacterium sp.]